MQAIITKFHGPTDTKGSRYSAKCEAMSIIIPTDHALSAEDNHLAACAELCRRMDDRCQAKYGKDAKRTWSQRKVSGQIPSGEYVHVFVPQR